MDLTYYQQQLQKRWGFPYHWGRKQNNAWDKATNFVYQIRDFEVVLDKIYLTAENHPQPEALVQYALNRWYNFHSAKALEHIFQQYAVVSPAPNPKDKYKDFSLQGIHFDHKTTVFPKKYTQTWQYAYQNPADLICWLYAHQSQEQRQHFENRLFVILVAKDNQHWKLKARLDLLAQKIDAFMQDFSPNKLLQINLQTPPKTVFSQIIWAIE